MPDPLQNSAQDSSPADADAPVHLFEVAFEVCNQVGGIYTVIKTKIPHIIEHYGDEYTLIGPYYADAAALEFEETGPDRDWMRTLADKIPGLHMGRWLVTGRPRVILIDTSMYRERIADFRFFLWKDHGIDTASNMEADLDEAILFGFAASELFELIQSITTDASLPVKRVAHFHEWQVGIPVIRNGRSRRPIPTVFTTHATILGRYIASNRSDFYEVLDSIDADAEAAGYNIFPRFGIERAAAHSATIFTSVSHITGREAKALLGRAPDEVLPNGIQITRFQAMHEFQNLHMKYKERIHDFVMGHFFPSYTFDLNRTLYFFISGRYEYKNKGFDLFIEAMHELNQRLKKRTNPPTIVSFIITKAAIKNVNVTALENQARFDDMRTLCEDIQSQMGSALLTAAAHGHIPELNELLSEESEVRLRRNIQAFRSKLLPRIVTHDPVHDAEDAILRHIRHRQLFNQADDPVKVVFHPDFLSAHSPLLQLDYDEFVRGCHMGIFPGYYEPWGYTPLECVASGIPAVTSDLAGFGSYAMENIMLSRSQGLMVLPRLNYSFDESLHMLVEALEEFINLNQRERIELRNRTERLGDLFDWTRLIKHYFDAHTMALTRQMSAP